MRSFLEISLIALILLLSINIASATNNPDSVIVNMPDKVSALQVFPVEIYIPPSLRENISSIGFKMVAGMTNNDDDIFLVSDNKVEQNSIYTGSINYSGEAVIRTKMYLPFRQHSKLPANIKIDVLLIGPHYYRQTIHKSITVNPTTLTVDLPDLDWKSKCSECSDFRSWGYWNLKTYIYDSDSPYDFSSYKINFYYGVDTYNLKNLKDQFEQKTKLDVDYVKNLPPTKSYTSTIFEDIKEIGSITPIVLPGFKEAYELNIVYGTRSLEPTVKAENIKYYQTYYIYGVDDQGLLLNLELKDYGTIHAHDSEYDTSKTKDTLDQDILDRISEIKTAASSYKLSKTTYDFEPLGVDENIISKKKVKEKIEEKPEKEIEQKDISKKEFTIKFSGKDSKTIWNRGRFNTGTKEDDSFTIPVKLSGKAYDSNGKRIKRLSDEELYSGAQLVTEIAGNESQIGLTESLTLALKQGISSDFELIDVRGKGPHLYDAFYKPLEQLSVHVEWKGQVVSNTLTYTVHVKDASPSIKLAHAKIEVQDGSKRAVEFKVLDSDKSKLTCSLMIPTDFALKGGIPTASLLQDGKRTTFIKQPCKDGDTIKVMYQAPSFGNFDLNNELNALSMWKMQQNTMLTLATDVVGLAVGGRLEVLEKEKAKFNKAYGLTGTAGHLKNAQNVQKTINTLSKANELADDTQNLIKLTQLNKNRNDLNKEAKKSVGTGKQGWLEWGADWGVYGIDIAQSTIGAIAMAPGKIPVLGPLGKKVGGTFSVVFNLMTNVWKGNFQYLSKVEKINRAKEMYFPYPVIITVEDEDGFVTKDVQTVMVVYNWLE